MLRRNKVCSADVVTLRVSRHELWLMTFTTSFCRLLLAFKDWDWSFDDVEDVEEEEEDDNDVFDF